MAIPRPRRRHLLVLIFLAGVVVVLFQPSPALIPGISDHTGPTEMRVESLERLDAGCQDRVSTYAKSSVSGGDHTRVSFVPTERTDASLGVWTERTSPTGADLSTFRVHIETQSTGEPNESCQTGILYEVTVSTSGGQPAGIVPDAYGSRILWLENGRYAGCSGGATSPLDIECDRFRDRIERTWANATDDASRPERGLR